MCEGDIVDGFEVRNRPSQLEYTIIRPRRKIELVDRSPKKILHVILQGAELTDLFRGHVGVAVGFVAVAVETLALDHPGAFYAFTDRQRGFAGWLVYKFLVFQSRDFDVYIYPVQQWAGNLLQVSVCHAGVAGAGSCGIV